VKERMTLEVRREASWMHGDTKTATLAANNFRALDVGASGTLSAMTDTAERESRTG
jgi:hypothetical protein